MKRKEKNCIYEYLIGYSSIKVLLKTTISLSVSGSDETSKRNCTASTRLESSGTRERSRPKVRTWRR